MLEGKKQGEPMAALHCRNGGLRGVSDVGQDTQTLGTVFEAQKVKGECCGHGVLLKGGI